MTGGHTNKRPRRRLVGVAAGFSVLVLGLASAAPSIASADPAVDPPGGPTQPLELTITERPPALTSSRDHRFAFTASDPDGTLVTCEFLVNQPPARPCNDTWGTHSDGASAPGTYTLQPYELSTQTYANAQNTITVTVTGEDGEQLVETLSWTHDDTAARPQLRRVSVRGAGGQRRAVWRVAADDPAGIKRVQVAIKRGASSWQRPAQWRAMPAGATLVVRAPRHGRTAWVSARTVDTLGNASAWTTPRRVVG